MAAAEKLDEEAIEKEASKLTRLRVVSDQNKAAADQSAKNEEKANRLAAKYMRALEEVQSRPAVTQIAIAGVAGVAGGLAGYGIAKKIRAYTDEKKWVNQKGERSIGAVVVGDIVPAATGLIVMVLGAFIENAPLCAGVMGLGGGIASGAVTFSLNAPKKP